ncbi:sensor histidine kinase [Qiania dongpingensis]|uniref:histidine kinase n=1 Tax=Qiania dongpingensis TaxID=2763669 RepID=A0A7G9G0Y8_9FIRM|nr:sensor histidine kinase KdpD [Qiania dongpingensis]QNM04470.1 sensor histidine kinase KdpD [Qiania dongpingensis]
MERAKPDEILRQMEKEEQKESRGHLKIFFGYAAGVGKTYAMLKAAHAAKRRGIDVVAGYIEPHTRPRTMQLLNGLETIPPLVLSYKGISVKEFDLDAAIARHPKLILVDELAHTNAQGSRHAKRYQDIDELLNAGIDVYTTVNVQHIESLNDIVASITGIMVQERIPDKIFDDASQVELVDIEPEDLINRLKEGEVYQPTQAKKALHHFFTIENLTALREIALRRSADRVNKLSELAKQSGGGDYYTDEHILVCLSASPSNTKIIRTAARMARAFRGSLTAIFVETPRFRGASPEDKKRLREHIHLAEQLGGKVETVYGEDVALQIAEYAKLSGASKIVLGRSNTQKRFLISRQSFTERLTELAPNLDIYIIPDKAMPSYRKLAVKKTRNHFSLADVTKTIIILVLSSLVGMVFHQIGFNDSNIIMVYILGVLFAAIVTTGRIYSIVLSLVSVLVFNFLFTTPKFTFQAYGPEYPVTFLVMFLTAFVTSSLTTKIKRQAVQSAGMAYRTQILLDTNQLLQQQKNTDGIIEVTASQLTKLLHRDIVFYPSEEGDLKQPVWYLKDSGVSGQGAEDTSKKEYLLENEQAVAAWVFKNNKRAGAGTDTLGNARYMYLAVRSANDVYGVVGIDMYGDPLSSFENSLLLSILGECALALEKDLYGRKREEAAAQAKNEQLRANLLRSISHDLRTPLTSISGNAGVLLGNGGRLDESKKNQLYTDIYDDSMWLINLVENLLSVTRIEDGTMHLNLETELLEEVITEARRHVNRKSVEHEIEVVQKDEFILAKMDARLIVQVIINLIDNAIKYTPPGSRIVITVAKAGRMAVVEVADNGPGIADDLKDKIFEMFYTANNGIADSRRSLGLGLALCKSIITAHGGTITVRDNEPRGTIFQFTLPSEEAMLHE